MRRGKTGWAKDQIVVRMYAAEENHGRVCVTDLARMLLLKPSTISGHLRDLSELSPPLVEETVLRGYWRLTGAGRATAQTVWSSRKGIAYYGQIAAGPAIPVGDDNLMEYLAIYDLDPETHFALRVQGVSMMSYHICDGDIVIMRRIDAFEQIPDGAIVAALVPEGTDVHLPEWHERLKQALRVSGDVSQPALDHVTLKAMDEQLHCLRGSLGSVEPPALQVIGVLVRLHRDYKDGRVSRYL